MQLDGLLVCRGCLCEDLPNVSPHPEAIGSTLYLAKIPNEPSSSPAEQQKKKKKEYWYLQKSKKRKEKKGTLPFRIEPSLRLRELFFFLVCLLSRGSGFEKIAPFSGSSGGSLLLFPLGSARGTDCKGGCKLLST